MEPPFLYAVCGLFRFYLGLFGFIWVYSGLSGPLRRFSRSSRFVASCPHIGDIFGLPTPLGMPWLPCLFRKSRISKRETGFFAYGGTVQTVLRRFYTPVCEISRILLSFSTFSRRGVTKGIVGYSPCIQNCCVDFPMSAQPVRKWGTCPEIDSHQSTGISTFIDPNGF